MSARFVEYMQNDLFRAAESGHPAGTAPRLHRRSAPRRGRGRTHLLFHQAPGLFARLDPQDESIFTPARVLLRGEFIEGAALQQVHCYVMPGSLSRNSLKTNGRTIFVYRNPGADPSWVASRLA